MAEEFVERRCAPHDIQCPQLLEALEKNELKTQTWLKWLIGLAIPLLLATFIGILSHEARLTGAEKDVKSIKDTADANKLDTNKRLERIEEKQDQILMMLGGRK